MPMERKELLYSTRKGGTLPSNRFSVTLRQPAQKDGALLKSHRTQSTWKKNIKCKQSLLAASFVCWLPSHHALLRSASLLFMFKVLQLCLALTWCVLRCLVEPVLLDFARVELRMCEKQSLAHLFVGVSGGFLLSRGRQRWAATTDGI